MASFLKDLEDLLEGLYGAGHWGVYAPSLKTFLPIMKKKVYERLPSFPNTPIKHVDIVAWGETLHIDWDDEDGVEPTSVTWKVPSKLHAVIYIADLVQLEEDICGHFAGRLSYYLGLAFNNRVFVLAVRQFLKDSRNVTRLFSLIAASVKIHDPSWENLLDAQVFSEENQSVVEFYDRSHYNRFPFEYAQDLRYQNTKIGAGTFGGEVCILVEVKASSGDLQWID